MPSIELGFRGGTLELRGLPAAFAGLPPQWTWDVRAACHRAPALHYADAVRALRNQFDLDDRARRYLTLDRGAEAKRGPRPYQSEAFAAWRHGGGRGVVVLPTGAGKTMVAHMAIDDRRRSTLVVVPTLDLVRQWHDGLATTFATRIGIIGGGEYEVQPLTVTTYDSAYLHMEHLGDRFGLLVFDECHHLPAASYALAARLSLAPFRLGLTATPPDERDDDGDRRRRELVELVGPVVFRKDIVDLEGQYLATYGTERIMIELASDERAEYERERALYRGFLIAQGISMARRSGWSDFIIRSSRSDEGRRAFQAYRRQREIAFCAPAKLACVERLLHQHRHDRVILFTQDNATVYVMARRFLIPAITHQTHVRERSEILAGFAAGAFNAIATSRVLNEGVDLPQANVAIVISGSGSVREHVQRLGRILRKSEDKHALLYELVTEGTAEAHTSQRRREHSAYR